MANQSDYRGMGNRSGAYDALPMPNTPSIQNRYVINRPVRTNAAVTEAFIYVGSEAGSLYALDREMLSTSDAEVTPLWTFETDRPIVSTPVVDVEDRLYVGGLDKNVYALDAQTGELIAQYATFAGIYGSPLVVDDVVYIGSLDYHLYALRANDLSLIWKTNLEGEIWSSAAWGGDGRLYVGSRANNVYALDAVSGEIVWQTETGGWVDATPAVYAGRVYIGSHDGNFYALNAEDGRMHWQQDTGKLIYSSAAIGVQFPDDAATTQESEAELPAEMVYVNNYDGDLFAYDLADGTILWETNIGSPAYSSPVYVDGLLYIVSEKDGLMFAIDAVLGAERWRFMSGRAGDFRSASPTPYEDQLYVASNSEGLLVLAAPDTP